jgi:hypothetical protein
VKPVPALASGAADVHTPRMTLKNAALLALIGMVLLTIVTGVGFIVSLAGFLRGVVPAISLVTSLVRAFASLSLAVFFWVFQKRQN